LNSAKLLVKITEKWPIKVLSLAAALVIFVYNTTSDRTEERFLQIPLLLESNERFIPVSSFVNIILKGDKDIIASISEGDIEAYIDLSKYTKEGTYSVPVETRKKGSAVGVEPLQIKPSPTKIKLELEEKTSRSIPVTPVFQGTIAQDYELTGWSIFPETVTAEGPRRTLDSQKEFNTDIIDLKERFEDITAYVKINVNPNITILGSNMVEFRGTVRRIEREAPIPDSAFAEEDDDVVVEAEIEVEVETGDNVQ